MTACSSPFGLPISGSVQTLAPVEQQTQRVYTNPQGPADDAQPETIVKGFYDAMPAGVQSDGYRVAREFLTGSASAGWNGDSAALVYSGTPDFRRRANTISAPQGAESSLIVEVELQVVGSLDSHGVYTPSNSTQTRRLPYTLMKKSGQWRISSLESGVVISTADFEQVFRQVSVYQVSTSGKQLIPDIRWLSWRNWRTQAVGEVLSDAPSWLEGVLRGAGLSTIKTRGRQRAGEEQCGGDTPQQRYQCVERGRTRPAGTSHPSDYGRRNAEYALKITGDGVDYSDADANVKLTTEQPTAGVYTLTGGHIVSLASSSPLRVGEAPGYDDARGFVFSSSGGAVLRADGVVECLKSDGASCGVMFSGEPMRSITEGLDGEVWAVSENGRELHVSDGGKETDLKLDWLGAADSIVALAVSPEGCRLALAVEGEDTNGVMMTGVARNGDKTLSGLSKAATQVSVLRHVTMLTFYNDLNLVYATTPPEGNSEQQEAWRQMAPGPANAQRLPNGTITSMASGQISLSRRLAIVDDLGYCSLRFLAHSTVPGPSPIARSLPSVRSRWYKKKRCS